MYKYSFNGKEKDDEVKGAGNSYDFGERIYDPRLGRWLAIDPLSENYVSFSPYNFVANNPVIAIDPDGKKIVVVVGNREYKVGAFNLFKPKFVRQVAAALKYAGAGEVMAQQNRIRDLKKDKNNIVRIEVTSDNTQTYRTPETGKDGKTYWKIDWDPNDATQLFDFDENNTKLPTGEIYSSSLGLYHDLVHKWHQIFDSKGYNRRKAAQAASPDPDYEPEEEVTIKEVNEVARQLKEPEAKNHNGEPVPNEGDLKYHRNKEDVNKTNKAIDKDFEPGGIHYEKYQERVGKKDEK